MANLDVRLFGGQISLFVVLLSLPFVFMERSVSFVTWLLAWIVVMVLCFYSYENRAKSSSKPISSLQKFGVGIAVIVIGLVILALLFSLLLRNALP